MEDLSYIVKMRRLAMAGRILWLPPDILASVTMQWVLEVGKGRRGRPSRIW